MQKRKKLTPHDLAFGIGRNATKKALAELFSRPLGKLSTSEELLVELKERNTAKKIKKESVKQMPDVDTTKYIDYSQPLNLKQVLNASNASFKKKNKTAA